MGRTLIRLIRSLSSLALIDPIPAQKRTGIGRTTTGQNTALERNRAEISRRVMPGENNLPVLIAINQGIIQQLVPIKRRAIQTRKHGSKPSKRTIRHQLAPEPVPNSHKFRQNQRTLTIRTIRQTRTVPSRPYGGTYY